MSEPSPAADPAPSATDPSVTPPSSPRKQRALQRASDDAKGMMSLNSYLLKSDPYRCTFPDLDPNPKKEWSLPGDHALAPKAEALFQIARETLAAAEIPWNSIRVHEYTSIAVGKTPKYPLLTIDSSQDSTRSWQAAVDSLVQKLSGSGFQTSWWNWSTTTFPMSFSH